jgi:diguanylate cyclase
MRARTQRGGANYVFHSADMQARMKSKHEHQADLYRAWEEKRFVLHYHAICDARSGKMTGMEALIRWDRPEGPLVAPADFVGTLEDTGLIVPVGEWVIQEACRQNQAWTQAGLPPITVAVNVSPLQFKQGNGLVAVIRRALQESGLAASQLCLEITEGMAMGPHDASSQTLEQLKTLGVSIAIDDFGTGYSSLAYLQHFPVDAIKIDRSFVEELSEETPDANIVSAVIALAHRLNMSVTAEGVQSVLQLKLLKSFGCNMVQGFALGKPLPAAVFEAEVLRSQGWQSVTDQFFGVAPC